jgi:hypothetical protein
MQEVNNVSASQLQALIPIAADSPVSGGRMKFNPILTIGLFDERLHVASRRVVNDGYLHLLGAKILTQHAAQRANQIARRLVRGDHYRE